MSNINLLVLKVISEETGHAGVEMYNDGPKGQGSVQAGLFAEPGLKQPTKEGQKIISQGSSDESSFHKELNLDKLREASISNNLAGTNENIIKTGGNYEFSKKMDAASKISGAIIKSPNVKV
jgi:hypothetical protein